jgi:PAS domain S-box-containing protein
MRPLKLPDPVPAAPHAFLRGGGEMGGLCRAFPWEDTPLGPLSEWPQSLRSAVGILLPSQAQIILFWGPQRICIYNDAYRPIFGSRHPWALGKPGSVGWSVIWPVLGPLLEGVVNTGEAFSARDFAYFVDRGGFLEEVYFDVSYDPVRDETGGVGGVFCIVSETSSRVIGERRLHTLRDLGGQAAVVRESLEAACRAAVETIGGNERDVPFAMVYLRHKAADPWTLAGVTKHREALLRDAALLPPQAWPLDTVLAEGAPSLVSGLSLPDLQLDGLPEATTPSAALVLPLQSSGMGQAEGVLVAGVSPVLALDETYRAFFDLLARHISTALANSIAYHEEKRRAEMLAELDRAKTAFFSNVSHEFRTPLTLMLGPVEDLLHNDRITDPRLRDDLQLVHRNGLRLQKLVNTLLDFSRIEAGRTQAVFQPVDLWAVTRDLASNFRSLLDRAGLQLILEGATPPEPVYIDREMWEKIVFNLLSNAFKHTFQGSITVRVETCDERAVLTVADTGTGIPEAALPRIFDRFHRVEGAASRTHEGTGIGLALVQELVRMHDGTIEAESVFGQGAVFRVRLPLGARHLHKDRIDGSRSLQSTAVAASAFVEEAARWLPDSVAAPPAPQRAAGNPPAVISVPPQFSQEAAPDAPHTRQRVLVVDDNADMREYIGRILSDAYHVESASDGRHALAHAIASPPDLVLADVMMPGMDGFELVAQLREQIPSLPVILVSARAGEEARLEGLQKGASDYLTKPFSARELRVRVDTRMELERVRRQAESTVRQSEERLSLAAQAGRLGAWDLDVPNMHLTCTEQCRANHGLPPDAGITWDRLFQLIHPSDRARVQAAVDRTLNSAGELDVEYRCIWSDQTEHWMAARGRAFLDEHQQPLRMVGITLDVTARKRAEMALRESEARFRNMADSSPVMIWVAGPDGYCNFLSQSWYAFTGQTEAAALGFGWLDAVHPEDRLQSRQTYLNAARRREAFRLEYRVRRQNGDYCWAIDAASPRISPDGEFLGYIGSVIDISERKHIEDALRASESRLAKQKDALEEAVKELRLLNGDLNQFAFAASHDLKEPLRMVTAYAQLLIESTRPHAGDEAAVCVRFIEEGIGRMHDLLGDLLAYTQVASPENLPTARVPIEDVLNTARANLKLAIEESGAVVTSSSLPTVRGSHSQLVQVLQNLIGNALKYHGDLPPRIHVSAEPSGNDWRIAVSDNGMGIAPEYHQTIFGVFKRLHTKKIDGTGIGLAICQRIVERTGGRIWVESSPGNGSTFYFTAPSVNGRKD